MPAQRMLDWVSAGTEAGGRYRFRQAWREGWRIRSRAGTGLNSRRYKEVPMQLSIKVTAVAALVVSVLVAQIARADITAGAGSGTTPNANVDVPLPAIVANDVTVAGPSSAQVGATVDPNGLPTSVHFEYGANNVLNLTTPSVSIGGSVEPTKIAADLLDLQPGTSY